MTPTLKIVLMVVAAMFFTGLSTKLSALVRDLCADGWLYAAPTAVSVAVAAVTMTVLGSLEVGVLCAASLFAAMLASALVRRELSARIERRRAKNATLR